MLNALRGHGWVISSEEQDTHELFHVLTATIDDELMNSTTVPSLLDVSWVDVDCMNSLKDGVVLKANSWEQTGEKSSIKKEKCSIKKEKQFKNNTDMIKERNSIFSKVNGHFIESKCDELNVVSVNGTETHSRCNNGQIVKDSSFEIDTNNQNCDIEGCEDSVVAKSLQNGEALQSKEQLVSINGDKLDIENTSNSTPVCGRIDCGKSKELKHDGESAEIEFSDIEDDGIDRNVTHGNKARKKSHTASGVTQTQGTENSYWKIHSDQPDSPFLGYLASQLQCTLCGHKVGSKIFKFLYIL